MGFRLPAIRWASFTCSQDSSKVMNVPKGYLAVYVGEKMKRFLIPMSYLNQPSFQDLLHQARKNRISSSDGWSHDTLHKRYLLAYHFSIERAGNLGLQETDIDIE